MFFKRLFCKHEYKCQYTYLVNTGMRKASVFKCNKCGKVKTYIY
jgi:hypothetical protein